MKKVMVLLANGFEEIEALTVVDILRRGNVNCHMVSIGGNKVKGAHGIEVIADKTLDSVEENLYDAIVLPGGMPGAENLKNNTRVVELVQRYYSDKKLVCAICAAPMVLGYAGIMENVDFTCYPGFEVYVKDGNKKEDLVVKSHNIITGKGPAAAFEFAYLILKTLGNKNTEEISKAMMF